MPVDEFSTIRARAIGLSMRLILQSCHRISSREGLRELACAILLEQGQVHTFG